MWPDEVDRERAPGWLVPTKVGVRVRGSIPARDEMIPSQAFVPAPLPATIGVGELLAEVHEEFASAVRAVAALDARLDNIGNPNLLIAPLMQREAILSSRIENTIASAEEVALYESRREAPNRDAVEVWNYRQAMAHGLASPLPISKRLICEMHSVLMTGAHRGDRRPGKLRTHQNWIGSDEHNFRTCRFVPPPATSPKRDDTAEWCLDQFESYVNRPDLVHPELIAIGMAHYQFESIHPFGDGNGRLGRLLVSLMLCRRAMVRHPVVYVSGYFEQRKPEYNDHLLRVSTEGGWAPWVRFFLRAVSEQAADTGRRVQRLQDLRTRAIQAVNKPGAALAIMRLVDQIIEHPVITTAEAAQSLGMTPQGASAHIRRLEETGFLTDRGRKSYGRVWVAQEVLNIIEDHGE